VWDLAERWLPDAFTAADRLGRHAAATAILDHFRALELEPDRKFLTRVLRWRDGERR